MAEQMPVFQVTVTTLPKSGFPAELEADAAQRDAVAGYCDVSAITELSTQLLVTRWRGSGIRVAGSLRAVVEQPCVITLETVTQEIEEPVDATFLPENSPLARPKIDRDGELLLDPEGADAPEKFDGLQIDLWAVAIEALVLAIDPWPKVPGAALATDGTTPEDAGDGANDADQSPFAALSRLKTGENG